MRNCLFRLHLGLLHFTGAIGTFVAGGWVWLRAPYAYPVGGLVGKVEYVSPEDSVPRRAQAELEGSRHCLRQKMLFAGVVAAWQLNGCPSRDETLSFLGTRGFRYVTG